MSTGILKYETRVVHLLMLELGTDVKSKIKSVYLRNVLYNIHFSP